MSGLLTPQVTRGQIAAISTSQINFAATEGLAYRPIKLGAPSGRSASLVAPITPVTLSGTAERKYLFAKLLPPTGTEYGGVNGLVQKYLLGAVPLNMPDLVNALRTFRMDNGALSDPDRDSPVQIVWAALEAPPDTHHVSLGYADWDGVAITNMRSYEGELNVSFTSLITGQCRLSLVGNDLVLLPYGGNNLMINNTSRAVPDGGISLAPTGLTLSTFYNIFAAWNGTAIVPTAESTATTSWVRDAVNGTPVKSGDATKAFVGTHMVAGGPTWSRLMVVRSFFNDPSPTVLIRGAGNPLVPALNTSTTETTLLSEVLRILAGTLAVGKTLRTSVKLDYLNNTGSSRALTLREKVGGVTVATIGGAAGFDSNATQYGLWPMIEVTALAASVLAAAGTMDTMGNPAPGNQGVSGGNYVSSGSIVNEAHTFHNAAAVDWSVDQAFEFTAQHDNSSAQQSVRILSILVEIV